MNARSRPQIRGPVSEALSRDCVAYLRDLLISFHHRYPHATGDVNRFVFLQEEMIDCFWSFSVEAKDPESDAIDPMADNLDSGNAMVPPFPGFVRGVQAAACDLDAYREYVGPWPLKGLREAVFDWLVNIGFLTKVRATTLSIAVGAGTVHLYDLLCRLLIRRPGDIVIIPEMTYGFFIPQIERSRGQMVLLKTTSSTKVSVEDTARVVDAANREAISVWLRAIREQMTLYACQLIGVLGPRVGCPSAESLDALLDQLGPSPDAQLADSVISQFIKKHLCRGDSALANAVQKLAYPTPPGSPRVVAYLHINPNLYGVVYERDELHELAKLLNARNVTIVEDLAYHSLGRNLGTLATFLDEDVKVFTLLGVSKPLSIADCRLGLMLAERESMRPFYRLIENSIGFAPMLFQRGLKEAFQDQEALNRYLETNWSCDRGYHTNLKLMIVCFEGITSNRMDVDQRDKLRRLMREGAAAFFDWKRSQGVELFDPDHVFADGKRSDSPQEYQLRIASDFTAQGLSPWFEITKTPECGFFVIADCSRILDSKAAAVVPLRCSYDVFALLTVLFGVRTIPEECMGELSCQTAHRLRFTYSVPVHTIIRTMLTIFIGLHQLERIEN